MRGARAPRPVHGGVGGLTAGAGTPLPGRARRRERRAAVGGDRCPRARRRPGPARRRRQQRRRHAGRMPGARRGRRVTAAGCLPIAAPARAGRSSHPIREGVSHQPGVRQRGSRPDVGPLPGRGDRAGIGRAGAANPARRSAPGTDHVRGGRSRSATKRSTTRCACSTPGCRPSYTCSRAPAMDSIRCCPIGPRPSTCSRCRRTPCGKPCTGRARDLRLYSERPGPRQNVLP